MASCELCGRDVDSTKKVKIEGAKLSVCDSCSDLGEEVGAPKKKRTKKKKRKKSSRPRESEVLVSNYGKKVKQARESKDLSLQDLSDKLNEKNSRLSKIEKQELKPDKKLSKKLKKHLGIDLYTNPEVADYDSGSGPNEKKATLGDVANVKDE